MIVKLIYDAEGTIDVELHAFCLTGSDVSHLLDRLKGTDKCITVERLTPDGKPLQDPEILKRR